MDYGPSGLFYIVGLILSFLFSAFFSTVKIVFSSVNRNITADDEYLRYYTSKITDIIENKNLFSGIVAFGKTTANIAFAYFSLSYFGLIAPQMTMFQHWAISFLFSIVFLNLFAHHIPRALAFKSFRSYIAPSYYIYRITGWFFIPFVTFFLLIYKLLLKLLKYDEKLFFLTDQEKARMSATGEVDEALNEEEKEMIRSIFDLSETTVDEIMVPRIDMKGLDISSDMHSVLKIIREEGHSRIPVFKETIDNIVGLIYAKDILSWLSENRIEDFSMASMVKKAHFVPMGKKVNDLMRVFKVKHIHLAIVVDEYGGTAGMVTMEDILEEIVGDIQDEYDVEEREIIQISQNTFLVDPHIDLDDLSEELRVPLEQEGVDYNTLGGLVYHEIGDVPQENAQFDFSGLHFTVVKMDNQRIEKVKVELLQKPEQGTTDTF
ncbi:hemolysin family protein [Chitinispirillales bacterium ANBcel5]|uniref:hemolysin family protein n=1 Tax=Cellulosispirillum alkaliphilum TaxID=3039283 RepID=UPI002A51B71A|nr:hemolysin family protein [Chitinispirillales bacterium ANBcel5]